MAQLSSVQMKHFRDTGYLAIPGFFTEDELLWAQGAYDRVWHDLSPDVVVDTEATGRRIRISSLTAEERQQPFKVNDLYLRDEGLRKAVMSQRLGAILRELLADDPVIINTLSVEFGTQQADHLDTLFMTPLTPGRLVATWMALEDVEADAGPLRYYPESNHIEPYQFEDGGYHVRDLEMSRWADYMAGAVDRHGLQETRFLAKRGDLFIWDAWLLHGGSEICQPGLTRRSLITHYFTRTDCETLRSDLRPLDTGWWMNRPPQPVPGDDPATAVGEIHADPVPNEVAPQTQGQVRPAKDLRERLEDLDPVSH